MSNISSLCDTLSQNSPPTFSAVFVLGIAHCGSTLLGRILNMHSDILCVGEMMRIDRALRKGIPCTCGETLENCSFWKPYLSVVKAKTNNNYKRFTPSFYSDIGSSTGKRVTVDISKTLIWRLTRRWRDRGEGYIFLVRDPRGSLAASVRMGKDFDRVLKTYTKWIKRLHKFSQKKSGRLLVVHYEDLCSKSEAAIRELCDFIGIDFQEAMLRHSEKEHHFIDSSGSPYLKGSNKIKNDERWRCELQPEIIDRIEEMMLAIPFLRDYYIDRDIAEVK